MWIDGQTDVIELIVVFPIFSNTPKTVFMCIVSRAIGIAHTPSKRLGYNVTPWPNN